MDRIPMHIAKTLVDTFNAFSGTKSEFNSTFSNGDRLFSLFGSVIENELNIIFKLMSHPIGYTPKMDGLSESMCVNNLTGLEIQSVDNSHQYLVIETTNSVFKIRTED